jgi:hypothetical protein
MNASKCDSDEKYVISKPNSEQFEIDGLNPWTFYMVRHRIHHLSICGMLNSETVIVDLGMS